MSLNVSHYNHVSVYFVFILVRFFSDSGYTCELNGFSTETSRHLCPSNIVNNSITESRSLGRRICDEIVRPRFEMFGVKPKRLTEVQSETVVLQHLSLTFPPPPPSSLNVEDTRRTDKEQRHCGFVMKKWGSSSWKNIVIDLGQMSRRFWTSWSEWRRRYGLWSCSLGHRRGVCSTPRFKLIKVREGK